MADTFAPAPSARSDFWRRARRNPNVVIGGSIVALILLASLIGPTLVGIDPNDVDVLGAWAEPGPDHLLGGDALGRDILARLLLGGRVSLLIAASVLAITLTVGTTLGMLAGYLGGWVDSIIMRTVDLVFAFPEIIFAILVASMMGAGWPTVVIALSLVWWPGIARMARSLVLSLKSEMFIEAAVASGTPTHRILFRHFLPNIVAPLIVRASIGVGFIIMAEATLSFLGIGVQEPTPTWGGMIRDGLPVLRTDPYLALFASAALGVTLVGFNLLGDGLRDILDPRVRER